jgi:hypothetical protein
LRDGEVAGAWAGVGYICSEVAGVGQDRRGEPGEHTGGVLAMKPGPEMGERRRDRSGRVGGNSGEESRLRGEAIECDRARSSSGGGRGVLWANIRAWGGVELSWPDTTRGVARRRGQIGYGQARIRKIKHENGCLTSGRSSR